MASAPSIVRGRVVDDHGAPVTGASVYIVTAPAPVPDIAVLTDHDGRFAIAVPTPGLYRFGARSTGGMGENDIQVSKAVVALEISIKRL